MARLEEALLWSLLHDMGSPLQMAAIALGLGAQGRLDAGSSRDAVRAVEALQRRLAALRRLAVRPAPEWQDTTIDGPLREALAMLGPDAPTVDVHGSHVLRCDADALAIVLQNLLQNATRHADRGAPRIRVDVGREADGRIVVAVTNNGDAMPPGALQRLQVPGVQGRPEDHGHTPAVPGHSATGQAGLGLAIAAALLEWQGSRLRQVPVQRGTRLEFPFVPAGQAK